MLLSKSNSKFEPQRRISAMESTGRTLNASVKTAGSHRCARTVLIAVAIFGTNAIAPRLTSEPPLVAPTFSQTNLVSDVPGMAKTTDPNLVNPWGMALGLNSGIWISNNGSGKATTYDGTGQPIPSGSPQTVTIPAPGTGAGKSSPTGVASNATDGFVISRGAVFAPSVELFATEEGVIAGWNATVDPSDAVIAVDNSAAGAVYKGLALGFNESGA